MNIKYNNCSVWIKQFKLLNKSNTQSYKTYKHFIYSWLTNFFLVKVCKAIFAISQKIQQFKEILLYGIVCFIEKVPLFMTSNIVFLAENCFEKMFKSLINKNIEWIIE